MKDRLFIIFFSILLLSHLLCSQVFANSVVIPATEAVVDSYSPVPFTVEGNLTLDDNVTSADNKEFYTVHSKNGNEFFIIVDKANDSNNVYFLNAVDEQDLLSLVDEYQDIYITTTTEEATTIIATTELTTEITSTIEEIDNIDNKNKEGSILPVAIIVVIIVGIIGFLRLKKKNNPDDDPDDEREEDSEDSNNKETEVNSDISINDNEIKNGFEVSNNNLVLGSDADDLESPFSSETNSDYETVELSDDETYNNKSSNAEEI